MSAANTEAIESPWKGVYRVGGAAALIAGIVFRRNLDAEVSLLGARVPDSVADWFALLQSKRLLGLTFLSAFDVVDYALVGLMFLALCAAFWRANRGASAVATACGMAGIAVYFASNTAFSMLSLSDRYTVATTDAQRSTLLAAGQVVLAADQGTGVYMSLLLIAVAGLLFSLLMLRSGLLGRSPAYVGILASAVDLAYCVAYPLVPAGSRGLAAVLTLPAAGLFLMAWHILVGLRLWQLGRREGTVLARGSVQ